MSEIPKKYDPKVAEDKWQAYWSAQGTYKWDDQIGRDDTFSVDTPPPTVSGSLHIGHCFSYSHQDFLVRYQRMQGKNIQYGMGWDDNGLPTERRVQNIFGIRCDPTLPYDAEWTPRRDKGKKDPVEIVSRKNFIEACALVTHEDEKVFEDIWTRLSLSVDWTQTYATIDEHCRRISQVSFLDLVKKGFVYNVESPTMWDVDFQTAVAQAECEDRDRPGTMHDIRFAIENGGELTIATTRPELLAGCIAVVAHPDDERFKPLFGQYAITPLFHCKVPILASEHADPEKGTGILMVCTFGDSADVDWWKQSSLPLKQVIGLNGHLLPIDFSDELYGSVNPEAAHTAYAQLDGQYAKKAKRITADLLREEGTGPHGEGIALVGEPKQLNHPVKFYEKGDRPLEFVPTRQWFIKILEHKDALLAQGAKIEWHPSFMRTRFDHWVEGLNQDWCISRQRYFGVPFPVWYPIAADGRIQHDTPIYASADQLPVDPMSDTPAGFTPDQRGVPGGFSADPDVMDTWATSSMTPQIQSHWSQDDERHNKIFPFDIRPQSHEIIRTWAFYTIVKAWMHENEIPWKHVTVSGWVLDPDRKKMSKSKGNVITPEGLFDEFSVDGIRYWAARASLGSDTANDPQVFKQGKRLANKIFNASKFVHLQLEGDDGFSSSDIAHPLDHAFILTLNQLVAKCSASFEGFDFATVLHRTEELFWQFCDHYLELVKTRAYAETESEGRRSARATLMLSLQTFLKLLAPFQPYVTEEVWSWQFAAQTGESSIHKASWPTQIALQPQENAVSEETFAVAISVVSQIRGAKSAAQKSLKWPVEALRISGPEATLAQFSLVKGDVLRAGIVDEQTVAVYDAPAPDKELLAVEVDLAAVNPNA